jgi:hypothetical protein
MIKSCYKGYKDRNRYLKNVAKFKYLRATATSKYDSGGN